MKTDDLLLYGGLAVVAYLFLRPNTVAPGVTQVAPVTAYIPPSASSNVTNSLLTAAAGLTPVLAKLFTTPSTSSPAATAAAAASTAQGNAAGNQVANNAIFNTPPLTAAPAPYVAPGYTPSVAVNPTPVMDTSYLTAPVASYTSTPTPVIDTSYLTAPVPSFTDDYPGAEMSGVSRQMAGCIGLF